MADKSLADAVLRVADELHQVHKEIHALRENNNNNAVLQRIAEMEHRIMSKITDQAAAEQADLDAISAKLDTVVAGIVALDALITAFQNSPGTLTPADQAALDAIQASVATLRTKAEAVDTTAPVPPTP